MASDKGLSRIPFRVRDEQTISSMARWMHFVGAIQAIGGLLTAFVLLVAIIYIGAALSAGSVPGPGAGVDHCDRRQPIGAGRAGQTGSAGLGEPDHLLRAGCLRAGARGHGTMLGYVLYQAADDFDRVARTDIADQDYIAAGVARLNTYFKVSILLAVAAGLVVVTAAIGLAARLQAGS